MQTPVYTFTVAGDAADVQAMIDQDAGGGPGYLVAEIARDGSRAYQAVVPGDGAVIALADPADRTCWIGDVVEVEHTYDGLVKRVQINVR
jgi:hypothetical protein